MVFSASSLYALPTAPSDGHRCFDANNKDGVIDVATGMLGLARARPSHSHEASRRPNVPFKWALVNWNPHGHIPACVWDKCGKRKDATDEWLLVLEFEKPGHGSQEHGHSCGVG